MKYIVAVCNEYSSELELVELEGENLLDILDEIPLLEGEYTLKDGSEEADADDEDETESDEGGLGPTVLTPGMEDDDVIRALAKGGLLIKYLVI